MDLKIRYINNSIANVAGWVWLTILNIIVTPYMVHRLGYDGYGVLSLVLLVLGYFAFLDLGLGDGVIKYVSHYYALGDTKKVNRIINSILFLFTIIGLLGAVLIVLFTHFFVLMIFKIPPKLQPIAVNCFYISAFGFFLNLIFGVISKIPEALQRFDVSNRNNILIGTIVTLLNVGLLVAGYGVREVVIMNVLGSIAGIIVFYISARRLLSILKIDLRFSLEDFREVVHFGLYNVYTKSTGLVTNSINQFFVSCLVGTAGLTIFNVPFKIVNRFQEFIQRLSSIVFPVSSELLAQQDLLRLKKVYLKLARYLFFISNILFIPLLSYSYHILYFWMGEDFAKKSAQAMFLISLTFYFISWTAIPGLVALGMGRPKYNAIFSTITAFINLVFVYPLTKRWGVNGAAIAFFLSSIQVPVAIYVINKRVVQVKVREYITYVYGIHSIVSFCMYVLFAFVVKLLITDLLSFMGVFIGSYLLLIWLFWKMGLAPEDKAIFKSKLHVFTTQGLF